jgi:ADP-dependent NAD(P)H-hydrate dehydratase / NAD(P)H-hydrate epimerase
MLNVDTEQFFKHMPNLPVNLYNASQVRELERITIKNTEVSSFELMQRAGSAVFQIILEKWTISKSLVIFCGAGNNAGDGYVIARNALQAGMQVNVYSICDPANLKGDAFQAYLSFKEINGNVSLFQESTLIPAEVIVDALLGTGLNRPVTGLYAEAIQLINQQSASVISVDIPSGLHADTGNVMGYAVKADCTVTFIALKQGLFTGLAADHCGEISYASLALPDFTLDKVPYSAKRVIKYSWPRRARCVHKGHFGHVLVVGGELGFSGAAKLAGEAALFVGAGLVSIATRSENALVLNSTRPELMCHSVDNERQLHKLIENANVVVLGPGLGQTEWAKAIFETVIKTEKLAVIDADALNLLARSPRKKDNWILTPHPGEAARLLVCATEDIMRDRFSSAQAIQAKYGGITILKGAGTLIVSENDISVSTTGNPGMSSGGMGDVLSGVIGGLIAQGFSMNLAAQQGVWGHGLAADWAASDLGERGLMASDLMPYLRKWVNE